MPYCSIFIAGMNMVKFLKHLNQKTCWILTISMYTTVLHTEHWMKMQSYHLAAIMWRICWSHHMKPSLRISWLWRRWKNSFGWLRWNKRAVPNQQLQYSKCKLLVLNIWCNILSCELLGHSDSMTCLYSQYYVHFWMLSIWSPRQTEIPCYCLFSWPQL